jgi:hypothetical protein
LHLHLLLPLLLPLPLLLLLLLHLLPPTHLVISTEAMDSFTVHGAVERPPHFAFVVALAFVFSLALCLQVEQGFSLASKQASRRTPSLALLGLAWGFSPTTSTRRKAAFRSAEGRSEAEGETTESITLPSQKLQNPSKNACQAPIQPNQNKISKIPVA